MKAFIPMVGSVFCVAVLYGAFSLYAISLDIAQWQKVERAAFAIFFALLLVFGGCLTAFNVNDREHKK
jgi:hypothetical protein